MKDSFGSRATLRAGGREVRLARLDALERRGLNVSRLPYALRILLEKAAEAGSDVGSLRKGLVGGEAFPPSLRDWFTERGLKIPLK